jgi:hypothetical protein
LVEGQHWLLDIALDHVSLGRACLLEALHEGKPDLAEAESHLDQAVTGLHQAGQQNYLPLGLLARAELRRHQPDFPGAQRDLDEALLIATRGGMRLHETDCHLEQARLSLARGDVARARDSVAAASDLIEKTGYHRRDAELAALEQQLQSAQNPPEE